jgi:DNA-cytosine methyltransferase
MNVLSLFDGISGGMIALERAGIKVDKYFASEIDPYAIKISKKNYPNIIQLGDVNNWNTWDLPKIDLIMGGSPCTNLSVAGNGTGLAGSESSLFYKFVDILCWYKPKYFLLENVKMKKEWQELMSNELLYEPVLINSARVSAQNRERLYWANFPITQPEDKHIMLKDIVLDDVFPVALHNLYGGFKETKVRVFENKSPTIRTAKGGGHIPSFIKEDLVHSDKAIEYMNRQVADGRTHWDFGHFSDVRNEKSSAVVANFFKGVPYNVFKDWDCIRKFHPIECERLQTLPDSYTDGISDTQRYKCIGNGWTIDVVAHIFKGIK